MEANWHQPSTQTLFTEAAQVPRSQQNIVLLLYYTECWMATDVAECIQNQDSVWYEPCEVKMWRCRRV